MVDSRMVASFVFWSLPLFLWIFPVIFAEDRRSPHKVLALEGSIVLCDNENPCPQDYSCAYSHFVTGIQVCYAESIQKPRLGRCPSPSAIQQRPMGILERLRRQIAPGLKEGDGSSQSMCGDECDFDQDCPGEGQKCCVTEPTCGRTCTDPAMTAPEPKVTVLVEGQMSTDDQGAPAPGRCSISLVQSNGKNLLWDSGSAGSKLLLFKALSEVAGIEISNINTVLTSSAATDHVGNIGLFPDIDLNFNDVLQKGSNFFTNPFDPNAPQQQRYFIFNDPNIELIQTPGPSDIDTTLLVYNVVSMGTIALCGDLIYSANDWDFFERLSLNSSLQTQHRRTVFCNADYIVPGHGSMFQVTEDIRNKVGGCENVTSLCGGAGQNGTSPRSQAGVGPDQAGFGPGQTGSGAGRFGDQPVPDGGEGGLNDLVQEMKQLIDEVEKLLAKANLTAATDQEPSNGTSNAENPASTAQQDTGGAGGNSSTAVQILGNDTVGKVPENGTAVPSETDSSGAGNDTSTAGAAPAMNNATDGLIMAAEGTQGDINATSGGEMAESNGTLSTSATGSNDTASTADGSSPSSSGALSNASDTAAGNTTDATAETSSLADDNSNNSTGTNGGGPSMNSNTNNNATTQDSGAGVGADNGTADQAASSAGNSTGSGSGTVSGTDFESSDNTTVIGSGTGLTSSDNSTGTDSADSGNGTTAGNSSADGSTDGGNVTTTRAARQVNGKKREKLDRNRELSMDAFEQEAAVSGHNIVKREVRKWSLEEVLNITAKARLKQPMNFEDEYLDAEDVPEEPETIDEEGVDILGR